MRHHFAGRAWYAGLLCAVAAIATGPAHGQADADAALKDRVLQLVDRLDGDKPEARDAAAASLIKLGSKILPLLPDPATVKSGQRKEQLERIRTADPETRRDQHWREQGHDRRQGNPAQRGTATASEADRQRDHGPA